VAFSRRGRVLCYECLRNYAGYQGPSLRPAKTGLVQTGQSLSILLGEDRWLPEPVLGGRTARV